jgi:hypothetical protein
VAQLSEWLQIMLAEIGRKQEEALRSAEEERRRASAPAAPTPPTPSAAGSAPKHIAAV